MVPPALAGLVAHPKALTGIGVGLGGSSFHNRVAERPRVGAVDSALRYPVSIPPPGLQPATARRPGAASGSVARVVAASGRVFPGVPRLEFTFRLPRGPAGLGVGVGDPPRPPAEPRHGCGGRSDAPSPTSRSGVSTRVARPVVGSSSSRVRVSATLPGVSPRSSAR